MREREKGLDLAQGKGIDLEQGTTESAEGEAERKENRRAGGVKYRKEGNEEKYEDEDRLRNLQKLTRSKGIETASTFPAEVQLQFRLTNGFRLGEIRILDFEQQHTLC